MEVHQIASGSGGVLPVPSALQDEEAGLQRLTGLCEAPEGLKVAAGLVEQVTTVTVAETGDDIRPGPREEPGQSS